MDSFLSQVNPLAAKGTNDQKKQTNHEYKRKFHI